MKQIWIAVYNKPLSDDSPLDMESHGFEVEAENAEQALEILKQRLDVSWIRYLFGVVKREDFDALVWDLDKYEIPVYVHPLPELRHSGYTPPAKIDPLKKLRGFLLGVSLWVGL